MGLGHIEIVRLLVAAGADASVVGTDGFTPLHQAVTVQGGRSQDDEKSEIVSSLLAGGAALEAVWVENKHPATPLGVASQNGFCVSAGLLLDAGADPHALGPLGLRPVHLAAYKGFPRCLEHLIDHGADVNAPSPNGKAYGTLYMACRGVQDYLHKIHGKPPPPENALRRWLYTFVTKPDDDALKKRWCPVYEVLFRAGAVVRPDWRDDPYAFMVEEFRGPICGFTKDPGSGEL